MASLTEMQNARGIMDVLSEMLNALDPGNKEVSCSVQTFKYGVYEQKYLRCLSPLPVKLLIQLNMFLNPNQYIHLIPFLMP